MSGEPVGGLPRTSRSYISTDGFSAHVSLIESGGQARIVHVLCRFLEL
jgi:hypothetical protein